MGISFLLAAPVINPVVIASTYAAFGNGPVFWGRLGLTLLMAVITGLVFSRQPDVNQILREPISPHESCAGGPAVQRIWASAGNVPMVKRLRRVAVIAADEFFEMGRYLVIGSLLAALLQTLVPQTGAGGPGARSGAVDDGDGRDRGAAFGVFDRGCIYRAGLYRAIFHRGAAVFPGVRPMVDIKSTLMFTGFSGGARVVYLVLLPLLLTLISTAAWNLIGK